MPSRSRRASAKSEAPTADRLEETWRRYYASIFNPGRLKVTGDAERNAEEVLAEPAGGLVD